MAAPVCWAELHRRGDFTHAPPQGPHRGSGCNTGADEVREHQPAKPRGRRERAEGDRTTGGDRDRAGEEGNENQRVETERGDVCLTTTRQRPSSPRKPAAEGRPEEASRHEQPRTWLGDEGKI